MNTIFYKRLLWNFVRKSNLGGLILEYYPKSILRQDGWFRSFREEKSIDHKGYSIPWLTYSFIHFIEPRLKPHFRIFEYGCGYSTVWYGQRVKEVVSVESNLEWVKKIHPILPSSSKVLFESEKVRYANEVRYHGCFEIIVIDGNNREDCCLPAIQSLSENGVIIWDNSERDDFKSMKVLFSDYKFREIQFYGMTPISFVASQTSILYRNNNCLLI